MENSFRWASPECLTFPYHRPVVTGTSNDSLGMIESTVATFRAQTSEWNESELKAPTLPRNGWIGEIWSLGGKPQGCSICADHPTRLCNYSNVGKIRLHQSMRTNLFEGRLLGQYVNIRTDAAPKVLPQQDLATTTYN